MFKFSFKDLTVCPICGDRFPFGEGGFIQTEDLEESKFVCRDCFDDDFNAFIESYEDPS